MSHRTAGQKHAAAKSQLAHSSGPSGSHAAKQPRPASGTQAAASTSPRLLDVNVLIALTHAAHVHHGLVQGWAETQVDFTWASCTVTQLGFVRLASQPAIGGQETSPAAGMALLNQLLDHPGHRFWSDPGDLFTSPALRSPAVVGHRQITDAYLLGLAIQHQSSLVTLDRGVVTLATAMKAQAHVVWIGPAGAAHEPAPRYRVGRALGRA